MADQNETELLESPSDTEENHLPSTQVTETHDIVTPHSDASHSLEAAFEERAKLRSEEQAEATEGAAEATPAEKPAEAAPEPEETDPRKRIKKQIEDAEKEAEAEKAEEAEKPEGEHAPTDEIQLPEGVKSQKAKDRFVELTRARRAAEERAASIEKEVATRDAKIKELEGRKPEGVNEDVQKQLDELAMFRRQYQLENSPEIKAHFDNIVADGEKFIGETLKGYGIAEPTIRLIEGEGGFAEFSRSQRTAMVDGEMKTYAEIAKDWLNGMNVADSEAVRAKLGEQRNVLDHKKRFIDAEKGKAKEYFTTQSAQYESSVKAQWENIQKQREQIDNFIKRATTETPWMKDKEIPATATPEQRKEIEADNKTAGDLRNILTATLNVKTMDELLDAALDATAYHKTRLDLARANKRIKELEAKESKRKAASATTVRQGSIASPPIKQTRKQENNLIDAADAFELALERKARGEE
jgi:hypothetical protein